MILLHFSTQQTLFVQAKPMDADCEKEGKVVCNNGHIKGQPGECRPGRDDTQWHNIALSADQTSSDLSPQAPNNHDKQRRDVSSEASKALREQEQDWRHSSQHAFCCPQVLRWMTWCTFAQSWRDRWTRRGWTRSLTPLSQQRRPSRKLGRSCSAQWSWSTRCAANDTCGVEIRVPLLW